MARKRSGRLQLRPEIAAFAQTMERKLRENDHKGGWSRCGKGWLLSRLVDESAELTQLFNVDPVTIGMLEIVAQRIVRFQPDVRKTIDFNKLRDEAVDVANFAMMIAGIPAISTGSRR